MPIDVCRHQRPKFLHKIETLELTPISFDTEPKVIQKISASEAVMSSDATRTTSEAVFIALSLASL